MRALISIAVTTASLIGLIGVAHAENLEMPITASTSAHLNDIKGQYVLLDTRVLTISGRGSKIYAEFDGHPKKQIIPNGDAHFTAGDRSFSLKFTQHRNGNVSGVTVFERIAKADSTTPSFVQHDMAVVAVQHLR